MYIPQVIINSFLLRPLINTICIKTIFHFCSSSCGISMSFLKIEDKRKREKTIKEFLALKKRIKARNLQERMGDMDYRLEMEEQYEPIIASNKHTADDITAQLIPIRKELDHLTTLIARPKLIAKRKQIIGVKRKAESDDDGDVDDEEEAEDIVPTDNDDKFGPLAVKFLNAYSDENRRRLMIDTTFGIRQEDDKWKIGDKIVTLKPDDSMIVGDEIYEGTPGFWTLVVEKNPKAYTPDDLARYKELLHETNALYQEYDPYSRYPRSSASKKWKRILRHIWQEFKESGVAPDENDADSWLYNNDGDKEAGQGIKMYLQKNGRCFSLHKLADGGMKVQPRPKLSGIDGDGLYLRRGADIFYGDGLLLGENSPFRNIPILGWLL